MRKKYGRLESVCYSISFYPYDVTNFVSHNEYMIACLSGGTCSSYPELVDHRFFYDKFIEDACYYMFIRPRAVAAASITIGSQKPSKSYLYTIEAELF